MKKTKMSNIDRDRALAGMRIATLEDRLRHLRNCLSKSSGLNEIIPIMPPDYKRDEIETSIQDTLDKLRAEYARLSIPKNKLSEKNRRNWK
tara:strand:- start:196 stop:468 length:273 start_codon:yes stop_codon:yes gene_type:complete